MNLIIIGVIVSSILFFIYIIFRETPQEKEHKIKLKKSLEDERLFDPETNSHITLEEAESGKWGEMETINFSKNNENKNITDENKQFEIIENYFNTNSDFSTLTLSDEQLNILNKSRILCKYEFWSYSFAFSCDNWVVFFPATEFLLNGNIIANFDKIEAMFWIKTTNILGHYYLRENIFLENQSNYYRNLDEYDSEHYTISIIEQSLVDYDIKRISHLFENINGLEIEIDHENIFIKTTENTNVDIIQKIEKAINQIF